MKPQRASLGVLFVFLSLALLILSGPDRARAESPDGKDTQQVGQHEDVCARPTTPGTAACTAKRRIDATGVPAPAGATADQGVSPQTLSVSATSPNQQTAYRFLAYLLDPAHQVRLAEGDWMLPTSVQAAKDPALNTTEDDWNTGTGMRKDLVAEPAQAYDGYPEWENKIATPAFQEYYSGRITLAQLSDELVEDGNSVLAQNR